MISHGAAFGMIYGVLGGCAIIAGFAGFFVYKSVRKSAETDGAKSGGADFWYSARNSQGWFSLGLSFFASSMGAWVLFAAPEVGILSGWWGTLGYALASSLPFGAFAVLGPIVRRRFSDGFCLADWVGQRFGRPTQVYIALVSVFYMWIYLVAELQSIGGLVRDMSGLEPLHALLPVSLVTMAYTAIAGLPASIWTDRLQGVIMIVFIIVAFIACFSTVKVTQSDWEGVSVWNGKGFEALVTLVLAIIGAELFNMSTWQRVYAAKSESELRKGCAFGMALIFPTMMLFGIAGMLAEAQDRGRGQPQLVIKALAFFDLLSAQTDAINVLVFALAVSMVASSVDSLQTGLVSVLSKDIMKKELSPLRSMVVGQTFLIAVNVPAIILATESTKDPELGFSIINLFLIADLLALSVTVPILMGLGKVATQKGALIGCSSGLLLIMAFGWFEFGTFMAGLEMITLMAFGDTKPKEFGLGASRTCVLFFLLPIVTGVTTYVASWMERVADQFQLAEDRVPTKSEGIVAVKV